MMSEGSDTALKGGFPLDDAAVRLRDEGDLQRAVTAYRFWYPTVSVEGIFNGNREIDLADNDKIGYCATSPRQVGFTLNSDTPYAAGALDLSAGPMVIELPPGAYIGLVDDHHQRWVMDMGIPGPDQGKGGQHLVLGPDLRRRRPGRLLRRALLVLQGAGGAARAAHRRRPGQGA